MDTYPAGLTGVEPTAEAPERATLGTRVFWGLSLLTTGAVVVTSRILTPNPLGHGTHTQLGLPPCGFIVLTGYPCPGCGLTTCFANMAHFDIFAAVRANSFGVMLFLVTLATIPLCVVALWKNWTVLATLERMRIDKWALLLSASSVATWLIRVSAQYLASW